MASRKKGSFCIVEEAEVITSELLEEYFGIYSQPGIITIIIEIQILLLTPFSIASFAYSLLNSLSPETGDFLLTEFATAIRSIVFHQEETYPLD